MNYSTFLKIFLTLNCLIFPLKSFEDTELVIHQASLEEVNLISFVSLYDGENNFIENLQKEDFRISYGEDLGEIISIDNFSSAQFGASYVFMVDISKSVTKENFKLIKESIKSWIKTLNPGDAASVITFGEEVTVISELTYDRESLIAAVDGIARSDMKTRLYDGLLKAHELSTDFNADFPSRKAIICLTDGVNEFRGGASKQEVFNALETKTLPIYTISFAEDSNLRTLEGTKEMMEIASKSNGWFFDANALTIEGSYRQARKFIDETFMITSICSTCDYNDSEVSIQISASYEGESYASNLNIRLLTPVEIEIFERGERKEAQRLNYIFVSVFSGLIVLLVLFYSFNRVKQRSKAKVFIEEISSEPLPLVKSKNLRIRVSAIAHKLEDHLWITVGNSFLIGRSSSCDLVIKDQPEISGVHCLLEFKRNSLFVTDQDSKNRTYVNGVPITEKFLLNSNDILGLGRAEYRLIFEGEEE